MVVEWCRRIAENRRFQFAILGVIVLNAVIIGLETSPAILRAYEPVLRALNVTIQAIFIGELAIRLVAYWPRPLAFFRDGWNIFDFGIVALSLLPAAGPFATVSRLARILRVARLVSVSPELRLIIDTMLRSLPSMGHVVALLSMLIYIYAILGYNLFHPHDPSHWGSLGKAVLSVFQLLTLEGWVEMQAELLPVYPWVWLYFSSFVVIGVFIVINLFIAVVLNNLETVRAEQVHGSQLHDDLLQRVEELKSQLEAFESALRALPADRIDAFRIGEGPTSTR